MTLNEYQQKAISTAIYHEDYMILYPALGLCGESGEVADKVKKVLRDDGGFFGKEKSVEIIKELGDVLWYLAAITRDLGFILEDVAQMNISKLADRAVRNKLQGSGDQR